MLIDYIGYNMETKTILMIIAVVAHIGGSLALGFWMRGRKVGLAKWLRSWLPKRFVLGGIDAQASVRFRYADAVSRESNEST